MALSDGSCSSVALRPGASIREVLQDLCHSLHINMAAVDLFLVGGEKVREAESRLVCCRFFCQGYPQRQKTLKEMQKL